MKMYYEWATAGPTFKFNPKGFWIAGLPDEHLPPRDDVEQWDNLKEVSNWEDPYGDRRQELVVIGINMDRARIEQLLDTCLLTDEETQEGPDAWISYDNPWKEVFQSTIDQHQQLLSQQHHDHDHEHNEHCNH